MAGFSAIQCKNNKSKTNQNKIKTKQTNKSYLLIIAFVRPSQIIFLKQLQNPNIKTLGKLRLKHGELGESQVVNFRHETIVSCWPLKGRACQCSKFTARSFLPTSISLIQSTVFIAFVLRARQINRITGLFVEERSLTRAK